MSGQMEYKGHCDIARYFIYSTEAGRCMPELGDYRLGENFEYEHISFANGDYFETEIEGYKVTTYSNR